MTSVMRDTYELCRQQEGLLDFEITNCVKAIYAPFTDREISAKIVEMLTADGSINAEVDIIYQTLEGQRHSTPGAPGDWYFSGDYPTPGGTRLVNRAYINYYEGNFDKR